MYTNSTKARCVNLIANFRPEDPCSYTYNNPCSLSWTWRIQKDEIKTKELARKLLAEKKKEKALKLLKRKKAIEKRYNHCETNIENIQGLIDQIKETQQQQDILKALDGGNQAMKELHKIVSVDDAERFVLFIEERFLSVV